MTDRILPVAEWSKLADSSLGPVLARFDPARTQILVVEDGDRIVGYWVRVTVEHAECVWIDERHRGKGSVARRLWLGMCGLVRAAGASTFVSTADSPAIQPLLARHAKGRLEQEYVLWALKPSR